MYTLEYLLNLVGTVFKFSTHAILQYRLLVHPGSDRETISDLSISENQLDLVRVLNNI